MRQKMSGSHEPDTTIVLLGSYDDINTLKKE